jgi:hypothetical protein
LVEVFPGLTASASPPSRPDELLQQSRFTVTNDGYLDLMRVHGVCYITTALEANGGRLLNSISGGGLSDLMRGGTLHRGEAFTVPCLDPGTTWGLIRQADLNIIVFYRPCRLCFWHSRRFFRFVSRYTGNGSFVWEKQPTLATAERDFDEHLALSPDLKSGLE